MRLVTDWPSVLIMGGAAALAFAIAAIDNWHRRRRFKRLLDAIQERTGR